MLSLSTPFILIVVRTLILTDRGRIAQDLASGPAKGAACRAGIGLRAAIGGTGRLSPSPDIARGVLKSPVYRWIILG